MTYGITAHVLYRLKPGTCEFHLVWRASPPDHIDAPGPWIGRTFYFSTDWRLRALALP